MPGSHTKSQIKTTVDVKPYKNSVDIVTLNYIDTEIYEFKQMVKDILIKRGVIDYVAIEDQDEGNNLKIVKKDHAERLGIYHYRHCGMVFENEIQLGVNIVIEKCVGNRRFSTNAEPYKKYLIQMLYTSVQQHYTNLRYLNGFRTHVK